MKMRYLAYILICMFIFNGCMAEKHDNSPTVNGNTPETANTETTTETITSQPTATAPASTLQQMTTMSMTMPRSGVTETTCL